MSDALHEELEAAGVTLPVAYCMQCHKEVVVHGCLGSGPRAETLVWHCIFCDEEVLLDDEGVRQESPAALSELGFHLVEPETLTTEKGGCGSKGGGCRSGKHGAH